MRLIERLKAQIAENEAFYSFEYFPPSSELGQRNLQLRIDRMAEMNPLFVDIASNDSSLSLSVAKETLRFCGVDVMLHFSLPHVAEGAAAKPGEVLTRQDVRRILKEIKAAGVRNIFVDYADDIINMSDDYDDVTDVEDIGTDSRDDERLLMSSVDVVRLIRSEFGDLFTIVVPAFPEGLRPGLLPNGTDREACRQQCVAQLKRCVEAGADFCITEVFFDTRVFFQLVNDLRAAGITRTFPVVPGLTLIQSLSSFRAIVNHLGLSVPEAVIKQLTTLEIEAKSTEVEKVTKAGAGTELASSATAVQEFGIKLGEDMCRELLDSGSVYGLHFCTLNLESSVRSLLEDRIKITPKSTLPWRPSAEPKREQEDVRPIFWANRPKSYLLRTESWAEFPSGRWGSTQDEVSFGELHKMDTSLFIRESFFGRPEVQKKAWGEAPVTREEIFEVFVGFVQGRVPFLPWCEESLHLETSMIQKQLMAINRAGFLTINSQPCVNAVPSNDPRFGWGPDGGYVYQKAYIEFFTSPRMLGRLIQLLQTPEFVSRRQYVYHALDHKGNSYTNSENNRPCAVTWGVFPGKEVIQPTVVDPTAFLAWKDEAFALWVDGWASIYDEHGPSADLIHDIHDEYFLVNIVDNDFVDGNVFEIFDRLMSS